MADIINFRRARKAMARSEAEKKAAANRLKHGTPKPVRDASRADNARAERAVESHKMEKD